MKKEYVYMSLVVILAVVSLYFSFGTSKSLGGTTNFDSLGLSNDLTVGDTLDVTGTASFSSTVAVGTSTSATTFNVLGTGRFYPAGVATTTCDTGNAGALMYSTGTAALLGCDGSSWNALW